MEQGAVLESLSVLMKGEALPPWSRWHGIPSQPYEADAVAPDRQRRKTADAASRERRSPRSARSLQKWLRAPSPPAEVGAAAGAGDRSAVDASNNVHTTAA
jgi:hypothetical protein